MGSIYLDQILAPDRNNFALLRLAASVAVLISHVVLLSFGMPSSEPLAGVTYYNLGEHAVNVFFVLSGILVTASLDRSSSLAGFAAARMLRIFPALIVCVLLIAFVLGPLVSALPVRAYASDANLFEFLWRTMSASTGAAALPGVFANNPYPLVVDAPIWTLKYEIACYAVLVALSAAGMFRTARRLAIVIAVTWIPIAALLIADYGRESLPLDHLARFWLCFSFGMVLYRMRDRVPLSLPLAALAAFIWWATLGDAAERIVSLLALGYTVVWLASLPAGALRTWTNRTDLSFGIYIFGWPITQTLIWLSPGLPVLPLEAETILITTAVAYVSWSLVEQPALAMRAGVVARIEGWRAKSSTADLARRVH